MRRSTWDVQQAHTRQGAHRRARLRVLCHSWSRCRHAVSPASEGGRGTSSRPSERSALRQGLPARRTVTTDIAHARARSGDGYTLFAMVKTAISAVEHQGPPGGKMRGTLFVSMGTDWRSAVSKRFCITHQHRSPVSIKSLFLVQYWANHHSMLKRPYVPTTPSITSRRRSAWPL